MKRYTGHRSERYCSPVAFAKLDPNRALSSHSRALGDDSGHEGAALPVRDVVISGSEDSKVCDTIV